MANNLPTTKPNATFALKEAKKRISIVNKLNLTTISKTISKKNNSTYNKTFIGIDFGTSTTVVSVANTKDNLETIDVNYIELNQELEDGVIYRSYKIPTILGWYNNRLLVGEGANKVKLKLKKDKNLWHSFKMDLGIDMGAMYPYSELNNDKFKILNPKDAATLFFKYLKTQIEKYVKENKLPQNIEYAISIPASFEANQRKDLLDSLHANRMMIGKQALIDEPNAAFLSYISSKDLKDEIYISEDYPTNILVFDFGAGTCDISILEFANSKKGYFSKNLAISRFEAFGGNNIDKLIAEEILLPQFLSENNKSKSNFKTKELKIILEKLEKPAELLKIKVSDEFNLISDNSNFDEIIKEDKTLSINHKIVLKTKKGIFTLKHPQISYHEFININETFTNIDIEYSEGQTVFSPILSALEKSNLEKEDIDYILFIGGSAKNYLVRKSIQDYFDEADYLIPKDLQAHVSLGAAIHSLIHNGYDKNIIDPIISEPIILIIKDGENEQENILLQAGTIIPSKKISIDNLKPQRENQETIELPIYVGNKDKLLHNIELKSSEGFSKDSKIKLDISINADKMLILEVSIDDQKYKIEPLNPFRNENVNLKERKKFEAEKEYNQSIAKKGGKETKEDLISIYKIYDQLNYYLLSAEILEELYNKYAYSSLNNIGVAYGKAGNQKKELFFYKKDFEESPSAITACNIALKYKYQDKKLYKEWLEKSLDIDSNYSHSQCNYGLLIKNEGRNDEGKKLIENAFKSLKYDYENGYAGSSDIYWLKECARESEEFEYLALIQNDEKEDELLSDYDSENLTTRR